MLFNADLSDLQVSNGKAVGLGRVKIPKMPKIGFDYEIPLLSFIVVKRDSDYVATCIHLLIDGYGKDQAGACNDMVSNILHYLRENFKHPECADDAWNNLYGLSRPNTVNNPLWDKYHALQYCFAKRGISTDRYSDLDRRIQALQDTVFKLESRLCDVKTELKESEERRAELWDSLLHEISKAKLMESMIIEERVI